MQISVKTGIFFCLLLLASAVRGIDLDEAVKKRLVEAEVIGLGGYRGEKIELTLTSRVRKPLRVRVPAGWVFVSDDSLEQNLMVLREQMIALRPGAPTTTRLYTACTQSSNASPGLRSAFLIGALAEDALLRLAQFLNENEYWDSGLAQRTVWNFANRSEGGLRRLSGSDTTMLHQLADLTAEVFGIPRDQIAINKTPKPIKISSINTSVDRLLTQPLRKASLKAYDSAGNVVETYFTDIYLERGYFHYRFGLNHTRGDSTRFMIRLTDGERLIEEREISIQDTVAKVHRMKSGLVDFHYFIKDDHRANLGVYDSLGNLYYLIRKNHFFRGGNHHTQLRLTTYLPKRDDYVVRIQSGDKVLSEQALNPNERPKAKRYPRRVERGVMNFKIEKTLKNVRVVVYDESGKVVRELYHNSTFGHGYKRVNYAFFHWQGPKAKFYIRFEDQNTEEVLLEKCIRCE